MKVGAKSVIKVNEKYSTLKACLRKLLIAFGAIITVSAIYANPEGGQVTAGDATISQTATTTQINQTSQQAIINWNSFNIGANEATHFQQPNSDAITLNRINPGQGASQIFGQLTANGRIILVNQAGIYFASGARVDVGGIIASTTDISDRNFLAGKYSFDQPSSMHGTIINKGTIIAANNGLIALIGANVSNEGIISANAGHVILASGNKFTLDFMGDGLINFVIDEASSGSGYDQDGHQMTSGVNNSGKIFADGGRILLTAQNAQGVVDNAINMSGIAQARSVSQQNGEIILSSESPGKVVVAGKLDASGVQVGQLGGLVEILGSVIHLMGSSVVDVSGAAGGGTILVGGNFHGAGPQQHALVAVIDQGALLNANALINGNGGKVAIWSDGYTGFHGTITAQGSVLGGDGGFIETSGKYLTIANGIVNALAMVGKTGTWLLDPVDVYIAIDQAAATAAGMIGTDSSIDSGGSGGDPNTFFTSTTASASLLTTATLTAALSTANVIVTTNDADGIGTGNINVVSPVNWASNQSLTLQAENNITIFSNGVKPTINSIGGGGLTLRATNNIIINGRVTLAGGASTDATLTLSAASAPASITTGVNGVINVTNFAFDQGAWYQNSASNPGFTVTNDFDLKGDEFLRVAGGNGTSGNPYQLTDIYGLQGIDSAYLAGNNLLAAHFILNNSLDGSTTGSWANGFGFQAIGSPLASFSGSLNGQGYSVQNVTQNFGVQLGLFYAISGSVSNLNVTNLSLSSGNLLNGVGGLTRTNSGTITNVNVSGALTLSANNLTSVGGLVGSNTGTISNSSTSLAISLSGQNATNVGGLVGLNSGGTISGSYSTGTIDLPGSSGGRNIGGLVGQSTGSITSSYATGNISVANVNSSNIGGLIGQNTASLTTSYATGSILVTGNVSSGIGGLIGVNNGAVSQVDSTGTVTISGGSGILIGGLIGQQTSFGSLTNAYSTGDIVLSGALYNQVGGLIGSNQSTVTNTYAAGTITPGYSNEGGLIGFNSAGVVTNSYWNITNNPTLVQPSGVPLTTTAMQQQASFVGFDFTSTWGINSGAGFPFLLVFAPPVPPTPPAPTPSPAPSGDSAANQQAITTIAAQTTQPYYTSQLTGGSSFGGSDPQSISDTTPIDTITELITPVTTAIVINIKQLGSEQKNLDITQRAGLQVTTGGACGL